MSFNCPYCITRHTEATSCNIRAIPGPQHGVYSAYWCRREKGHSGPHVACWESPVEKVHLIAVLFAQDDEYLTFELETHGVPIL